MKYWIHCDGNGENCKNFERDITQKTTVDYINKEGKE